MRSRSRRQDAARGLEIFEIKPVILGGSPSDPSNKRLLTRDEHVQLVRYWNGVIAGLRRRGNHNE
jgi:hypothetical protein